MRSAVTGGAQMSGFVELVSDLLVDAGLPEDSIYFRRGGVDLPGFFRPHKQWDLIAVHEEELLLSIEFKSHVGSFGNNFNNRTEEALGNATDLLTAYREGAFRPSSPPLLGYLMLLEDSEKSTRPVGVREPHFSVFDEFRDASYARRYELLLTKLLRERLYDTTCLILSGEKAGWKDGSYREPAEELSFRRFSAALLAKVRSHLEA